MPVSVPLPSDPLDAPLVAPWFASLPDPPESTVPGLALSGVA
jgi:hypothetical protein